MAATSAPIRVLVVDTDARVRLALTELINASDGYTVVAAVSTADEPLGAVDAGTADVALVEVPSADEAAGLALIRALAALLPVVAVAPRSGLRTATALAGASAFCDGDFDALLAALKTALRQSACIRPEGAAR